MEAEDINTYLFGRFMFCVSIDKFQHPLRLLFRTNNEYYETFDKRRTFVGNKIFDHWHVVRASPVGAARTASSFSV